MWAQQQSGNEISPKNATYLSKNNKNRIIEYNTPFRVIQESSSLGMPTLYGSLIYYTGWESIDESERDFGIYSFKFVGDLNGDDISEIIVQSTQEFTSTYYVLQLKNNDFYEILRSTILIENKK